MGKWNLIIKTTCFIIAPILFIMMSYKTIKQISIWKSSVSLWSYVIDKKPKMVPVAYHNRCVAFAVMGQYDKAIKDCSMAISLSPPLSPHYFLAYYDRGIIHVKKGLLNNAIEDFSKALAINPDFDMAYNNRGVAYSLGGYNDMALKDFKKACILGNKQGCRALQNLSYR